MYVYIILTTLSGIVFFAGIIACIYCSFRWLWICFRHREDLKARKRYSSAAFISGTVSGLALIAYFAASVLSLQFGG